MDGENTASSVTIECDKGRYHTLNEALVMPYAAMSRQAYAAVPQGKGRPAWTGRLSPSLYGIVDIRAGSTTALSGAKLRAIRQCSRRPTGRTVTCASGGVLRDTSKTRC